MYVIGICDDEMLCREHIKRLCEQFWAMTKEEYQCVEFATGEELLAYRENKIHLLFLDIEILQTPLQNQNLV